MSYRVTRGRLANDAFHATSIHATLLRGGMVLAIPALVPERQDGKRMDPFVTLDAGVGRSHSIVAVA